MKRVIGALVLAALVSALVAAATGAAQISVTSVFAGQTVSGAPILCPAQSDGVRVCHGTFGTSDLRLKSFDGVPLEVYVILPPSRSSGADGPYPLIIQSHGWGGSAAGPTSNAYSGPSADAWAQKGYAVLQLTARGFNASCGSTAARIAAPTACAGGFLHLDDERYEARDAQYAAGLLVDAGIASPTKIGATGPSYGGGVSLELATLKDRVMNADGSLHPWTSPNGTPMSIAAAAPVVPWSDLVASLLPNGRTLDYQVSSSTADLTPVGIEKQSFTSGLFALGTATGYYSTPGTDPQSDVTSWFGLITAGEPYDSNPKAASVEAQLARYHSAYYLLDGAYGTALEPPAPLLIANGFTDDLFPVDEALRYIDLEHSLYPSDPVALDTGDFGHMRAQNKLTDVAQLSAEITNLFDHYLKNSGPGAPSGASATIVTCPKTAPSGPTYSAPDWAGLHPGEVDFASAASQTISSTAGNPAISTTVDPLAGPGACATAPAADQGAGVATYRLPAASGAGYTLLGSPTVSADLQATGTFPELAERLWDVDPATNTETLIARGVYRPSPNSPDGTQVFQLHPGAWHFAAGHIAKLELLGRDAPYARASNGAFSIAVSDVQLVLPVHEQPGSAPGVVAPAQAGTPLCTPLPSSRIAPRATRVRSHGAIVKGTAADPACAGISTVASADRAVTRVFVMIYRPVGGGRCRFLRASDTLSGPRRCGRPIELRARGTSHWKLKLSVAIPRGRYVVRSDAVDGRRVHQQRSRAASIHVRVR
jgi:dienelactone hydrolase